jgi:hypothetical protein
VATSDAPDHTLSSFDMRRGRSMSFSAGAYMGPEYVRTVSWPQTRYVCELGNGIYLITVLI